MINFELLSFNLTNPTLLFFILGVTFPFNITIGLPLYLQIIDG